MYVYKEFEIVSQVHFPMSSLFQTPKIPERGRTKDETNLLFKWYRLGIEPFFHFSAFGPPST